MSLDVPPACDMRYTNPVVSIELYGGTTELAVKDVVTLSAIIVTS